MTTKGLRASILAPLILVILLAGAGLAAVAVAATDEKNVPDFVPVGYDWCGYKNLSDGTWTYGSPETGALVTLFADGMSCRLARRHHSLVTYSSAGKPKRVGYTCRWLSSKGEVSEARCVKRGRPSVRFRWEVAA